MGRSVEECNKGFVQVANSLAEIAFLLQAAAISRTYTLVDLPLMKQFLNEQLDLAMELAGLDPEDINKP